MIASRMVAASLYCIALAAAAAAAYPIFGTPQFWVATSVSMIAGVLIAGAGFIWRWSGLRQLAATLIALVVLAVPLAAPGAFSGGNPLGMIGTVYAAIWTSWRRLTTIDLPVGGDDGLLMAPILLVLVATVLGVALMLRSKRGELAAGLPLAVLIWALLWGPPVASWLPLTVLFAGASLAAVATLRQARRRRRSDRMVSSLPTRFGAGLLVALLAGAAATAAALIVPLGDRVVLRENPPVPREAFEAASPLSQLRSNFGTAMRDEVLMTVTGIEEGDLIQVATLDVYTGEVFAADASRMVRISGRAQADSDARQLGFTIQGYDGLWLPTVGQPQSVTFVGERAVELTQSLMASDRGTGLLVTAGIRSGDGYATMAAPEADTPAVADLEPVGVTDRSTPLPLSALDWLASRASSEGTPGESLERVVTALEAEGYLSHGIDADEAPSRAGHSIARLDELFDGEHMVGDQEQFAAAAALMARELGFSSRVAVGFRPAETGVAEIRGRDATAWVEVRTESGWIPIEVVPQNTGVPETEDTASQPDARPAPPKPPALPEGGQAERQRQGEASTPTSQAHVDSSSRILPVIAGSAALLLLIALPFLAVVLVKLLRRRGRMRGSARERAAGAWAEFVDGFVDRGAEGIGDRTRAEFAGGDADVRAFAAGVDRAVFGAREPTDDEVASLWSQSDAFLAEHDAMRGLGTRLRSRLSLRSIFAQDHIAAAQQAAEGVRERIRERVR